MKNLPYIFIESMPHKFQRYETVGDYFNHNDIWHFKISETKADYEFLILIHEMIEWYLTQKRGISEKKITNFDINFKGKGEPGDDKNAPYRKEHQFATKIEKLIAKELKVNWAKYDKTINNLCQ